MISARRKRFLVRWRKLGWALPTVVLLVLTCAVSYFLFWDTSHDDSGAQVGSLLLFIFVYLNIVILCALAFVVGRNIVKLIFDRRKNILGSKLRLRLVVAFVGLTAVPTAILFILASGLLTQAMEGWFNNQVEASLDSAVTVAKQHIAEMKDKTLRVTERIASDFSRQGLRVAEHKQIVDWFEARRKRDVLYSVRVVNAEQKPIVDVSNATSTIENFREPALESSALQRALNGESFVLKEDREANMYVRAYIPIQISGDDFTLVASARVAPDLAQALAVVNDSYKSYEQIKLYRDPLKSWYILTLSMITGSIIFGAIWIGFYVAREITVPIQRLAEGTRSVARGNYDFEIKVSGDDEIGVLVKSFNQMTGDLKLSRSEAERRKLYIETILSNLAVGVIGLDTAGRITSINASALKLYDRSVQDSVGVELTKVLGPAEVEQILPLLAEIEELDRTTGAAGEGPLVVEREITVLRHGRELKIVCTVGQILDQDRQRLGTVLLFDDITDLVKAQHMSAWREVARRIAHEIKNPLTPIQLSAQRLQRIFGNSDSSEAIKESTQTIVENVDSIKRLANEFSNFARMPTAEFKSTNLNALISDTIAPYAESHSEVVFQFVAENKVPEVMLDPEQIRRVLINLLENSIAALEGMPEEERPGEGLRIVVKTHFDRARKVVGFEVYDNGAGIKPADKTRIFEPYFTTKKSGTGLGLAVVTSIVSDHQGEVRVYDNVPHGAKFVVDLPLSTKVLTQRRFAGV